MEDVYKTPEADLIVNNSNSESGSFYVVSAKKFWVLFICTQGIYMTYWMYKNWEMIKTKQKESVSTGSQPYYKTFIQGVIIGVITGLIGAGGGFLYVPALVLWAGLDMKKAVGTSLVIVAINSLIGFSGDAQTLDIDWFFLLTFSLLTIVGILVGGYFSKFVSGKKLKKSFGWFVLVMSIYIILKELVF